MSSTYSKWFLLAKLGPKTCLWRTPTTLTVPINKKERVPGEKAKTHSVRVPSVYKQINFLTCCVWGNLRFFNKGQQFWNWNQLALWTLSPVRCLWYL